MARIKNYSRDKSLTGNDLLLGSSYEGQGQTGPIYKTRSYRLDDLGKFMNLIFTVDDVNYNLYNLTESIGVFDENSVLVSPSTDFANLVINQVSTVDTDIADLIAQNISQITEQVANLVVQNITSIPGSVANNIITSVTEINQVFADTIFEIGTITEEFANALLGEATTTAYATEDQFNALSATVGINSNSISTNTAGITTINGSITAIQTDVANNGTLISTTAGNLDALGIRVTTAESNVTTLQTDLTALNTVVDTNTGSIATNATQISSLGTTIDTANADIALLQTDLTSLAATVDGNTGDIATNATNISTLVTNVNTANADISALQTDLTSLTTTVNGNTGDIATNATNVSALATRVTTAEADITAAETNITSLTTTVNGNTGNITANANSISALQTSVSTAQADITNIQTDVTSLNTSVSNNGTNIATNASNITALGTRITTEEANVDAIQGSLTTLTATVNTNTGDISTNATAIDTLSTTVTTATADITALQTDLLLLSNTVDGNTGNISTNATAIDTLQTSVTTAEANIVNIQSDITSLDTAVTNNGTNIATNASNITALGTSIDTTNANVTALSGTVTTLSATVDTNTGSIATNATNIDTLTASVATANADITALETSVTNLSTTVDGQTGSIAANATAISALSTTVDTQGTNITNLSTSLTSLTTTVDGNTGDISTNTTNISDLSTTVTNNYTTLDAAITAVNTARIDGDTALSTSINTVSATVDGNTAAISTNATAISTVDGKLTASYGVTVDAQGRVAGLKLLANGTTGSEFIAKADTFGVDMPSGERVLTVDSSGLLLNGSGLFTGNLKASSGEMGGWLISENIISAPLTAGYSMALNPRVGISVNSDDYQDARALSIRKGSDGPITGSGGTYTFSNIDTINFDSWNDNVSATTTEVKTKTSYPLGVTSVFSGSENQGTFTAAFQHPGINQIARIPPGFSGEIEITLYLQFANYYDFRTSSLIGLEKVESTSFSGVASSITYLNIPATQYHVVNFVNTDGSTTYVRLLLERKVVVREGSVDFFAQSTNVPASTNLVMTGMNFQTDITPAGIYVGMGSTRKIRVDTNNYFGNFVAISGGLGVDGGAITSTNASSIALALNRTGTDGEIAHFRNDGVTVGRISVGSSTTSYLTTSDYRLKENIVDISGALDRLELLKPYRFNFLSNPNQTVDGFVAHEVQEIVPEAIEGVKDEMEDYEITPPVVDKYGNILEEAVIGTRPKYQSIDQSKLVPLLVAAMQEMRAEYKAEIELLKSQINS